MMSYQGNVKKKKICFSSIYNTILRNSVEYLRTLSPSPNTPSPTHAIPSLQPLVLLKK